MSSKGLARRRRLFRNGTSIDRSVQEPEGLFLSIAGGWVISSRAGSVQGEGNLVFTSTEAFLQLTGFVFVEPLIEPPSGILIGPDTLSLLVCLSKLSSELLTCLIGYSLGSNVRGI